MPDDDVCRASDRIAGTEGPDPVPEKNSYLMHALRRQLEFVALLLDAPLAGESDLCGASSAALK